jgi:hypothetical protein
MPKLRLRKIISGGQTGADRAGLDWAISSGYEYGGIVPKGRRAEDGFVPHRYTRLAEHPSPQYGPRTEANVRGSDATIIFSVGSSGAGSRLTAEFCEKHDKPFTVKILGLDQTGDFAVASQIADFIIRKNPEVINIAGGRESTAPIYLRVTGILSGVKKMLDQHQTLEAQAQAG